MVIPCTLEWSDGDSTHGLSEEGIPDHSLLDQT